MLHVVPLLDNTILHGIGDLEHGAGGGGLITAHNVLDDDVIVGASLFSSQDRSADDGWELVFGEILRSVSNLEETSASVKDWSGLAYANVHAQMRAWTHKAKRRDE